MYMRKMELQDLDSIIPLAMQWIQHTSALNSILQAMTHTDSDTFVLKVDAMELLEWNPLLAKAILNHPDFIAFKLWNFIFSSMDDPSLTLGKRMWLRFDSVPLPIVSAEKLWKTGAARGPSKTLVRVHGVVYATTTVQRLAYMRRVRCKGCGFVKDIWLHQRFPFGRICCSNGEFEEDKSASIYISSQEVLLGPVPTLSSEALPFPQLILIVLRDDLADQVQIGDSIAVIGHAFVEIKESQPCQGKCLSRFKVTANNIISPFNSKSLTSTCQNIDLWPDLLFLDDAGGVSLNALCEFLSANGAQTSLNVYARVALLISLVASENAANFHSNNDQRKQIHIMLISRGPCETLFRQLQDVAILYGARSVRHCPSSKNLLAKLTNSGLPGTQILQSGSLCRSNDGIFLVDFFSYPISRAEVRDFCEAMQKLSINVKDYQELCIPCRSTVWGSYALLNGESALLRLGFPKMGRKGPAIEPELINKFEIIISGEEEKNEFPCKDTTIVQSGESSRSIELRKHLYSASNIKSVKISRAAHDLIRTYYLAFRKAKSLMIMHSDDVFSLQTILRVASACVRLCLRDEILEIPDATLAILLCEKTQAARGGRSVMEDSSSGQLFGSAGGAGEYVEKNLDMEIKDFHHYLMQNLMSLQPSSL